MPKVTPKTPPPKVPTGDRVTSGIPGLDELIGGGFIPNDVYLVTGSTGTGKTLFCSQFLWEGLKRGENGIFFSLEEQPEDVLDDTQMFGWDFHSYMKQNKFLIQYYDPFEMIDIGTEVRDLITKFNAKRVVIDSTSIFGMFFDKQKELRKKLYELVKILKATNTTVLMTAEILEDQKGLSRYGVEEFIVDGVILLNYMGIGQVSSRSLMVRKMRRTNHATDSFPFSVSDKGLKIEKEKF